MVYICSIARKVLDEKLVSKVEAELIRRWAILCDLDDDLNNPKLTVEIWQQREEIDRFLGSLA